MAARPSLRSTLPLLTLAAALVAPAPAGAMEPAVVYDDTVNDLSQLFNPGDGREHGDEITLDGSEREVTTFEFLYWLSSGDGDETARVRFYDNDGPDGEPGTLLYDSGAFALPVTGSSAAPFTLTDLSVEVPDTFTWTVEWNGTGNGALNRLFDPPVVGDSDPSFYWTRVGAGPWSANGFATPGIANFYAYVEALPEPSRGALLLSGVLGVTALARLRRAAR